MAGEIDQTELGRSEPGNTRPIDGHPTLASIRRAAHERLDEHALAYLEGGSGAERTLRWNEEAYGRWVIRPRVCTGDATVNTRAALFGVDLAIPILVMPFGLDALFDPDGWCAV